MKNSKPQKKAGRRECSDNCPTLSMTGFGRSVVRSPDVEILVELKSVNNRYLDISLRLPRSYSCFEPEVRKVIGERLQRGRVDVYVERSAVSAAAVKLQFNRGLFDSYYGLARGIAEEFGELSPEINARLVMDVLKQREILELSGEVSDAELERSVLLEALSQALDGLCEMRAVEGGKLMVQIDAEIHGLAALKENIEAKSRCSPKELKDKLAQRLKELAPDVLRDEARLYLEATILAERIDVAEELTRLGSHLEQFGETLSQPRQGRKLDFVSQEIIREFNTIGSKTQDAEVRALVVEAKVRVDKIREQVQNIE